MQDAVSRAWSRGRLPSAAGWLLVSVTVIESAGAAEPAASQTFTAPEAPWWEPVLATPQKGVELLFVPVEAGVQWAERVNLPERVRDVLYFDEERTFGWFPKVSFGGDVESGVGATVFHDSLYGSGEELSLEVSRSIPSPVDEGEVLLEGFLPSAPGESTGLRGEIELVNFEDGEYFVRFGPGGDLRPGLATRENDKRSAEVEVLRTRFEASRPIGEEWSHGVAFEPIYGQVVPGEGPRRPIPSTLEGVGPKIVLLGGGPFFQWEGRDSPGRPREGWFARADGGYWSSVRGSAADGDPFRYLRYSLDLRRYQPTFFRDRIVVVRAWVERVETIAGGSIPFWERPILDKDAGLRGFDRNRFQDEGGLLFNAEYRYPVWDSWDAFVFLDEGQPFRDWSDIDFSGFQWGLGAGLRIYNGGRFLLQVHGAFSDEEGVVQIGLGDEF